MRPTLDANTSRWPVRVLELDISGGMGEAIPYARFRTLEISRNGDDGESVVQHR